MQDDSSHSRVALNNEPLTICDNSRKNADDTDGGRLEACSRTQNTKSRELDSQSSTLDTPSARKCSAYTSNQPNFQTASPPNFNFIPFSDKNVKGMRVHTRKYLCYRLPEQFSPEALVANQGLLAKEMAECLNVDTLMPVFQQLDHHVWMLAYLHPAERKRRLSTYEADGPGSVSYMPRLAATIVFDWQGGLLFISLPHPERCCGLAAVLKSAFPGRSGSLPFVPLSLSLEKLLRLHPEQRHPVSPQAPWLQLRLKTLTWHTAGKDSTTQTTKWSGDGFNDVKVTDLLATPERLYAATFQLVLHNRKRAMLQVYPMLGALGFSVSVAILASVRALLRQMP